MTATWKVNAEAALLDRESPSVLTTSMVHMIAASDLEDRPSKATLARWLNELVQAGKLVLVIKGVYLNRMGHPDISPAAAANFIRHRSVVSLSWVLEQAGLTNNMGNTVTCTVYTHPSWPNPQIGDRNTSAGPFRFFAMPVRLVLLDEKPGPFEDFRDVRFDYPRTTPEKALLDWIYLGASGRSRMTPPPLDIDVQHMDKRKLKRLVKRMDLEGPWTEWMARRDKYLADPEVRENSSFLFDRI